MKVKSIQMRLLVILLPLMLITLSLLAGVSYYFSRQALSDSVNQNAMAIGTDYGERLKADMDILIVQLKDLASIQRIRSGADKKQIMQAMAEAHKRIGEFDAIVFISPDGSGINQAGVTAAYADRDYFKKVIATKEAAVSEPLVSKSTGKQAIVLAVPVINENQLTGVLVGTFSVERLNGYIKSLQFLDTGYGYLADDSGVVIAHPKQPDIMGKLNLAEKKVNPELKLAEAELDQSLIHIFQNAAKEGKQTHGLYTFNGVKRVGVSTPINLPGNQRWVMMVAAPEAEGTKEIKALANIMLAISLFCLLLAGIAITMIAKNFAKPITVLRDECLLLAQGDLQQREAKVMSEDEIGQLAQGFRDMRASLRSLVSKVHSQAEQLAASSEELTASAEQSAQAADQVAISITDVAGGAAEQLRAANEATRVVETMSAGIEQVAATTHTVADPHFILYQKKSFWDPVTLLVKKE